MFVYLTSDVSSLWEKESIFPDFSQLFHCYALINVIPLKQTCCLSPILKTCFGIKTQGSSPPQSISGSCPKDEGHSRAVSLLWGPNAAASQPSAARRDPVHSGTEPPDAWAMHVGCAGWMWLKGTSSCKWWHLLGRKRLERRNQV